MRNITIISHIYDRLINVDADKRVYSAYFLVPLVYELVRRGMFDKVVFARPGDPRQSDVAILHVDATVVPDEYLEYAATFPLCLNGNVADISKKMISGLKLESDSNWNGPVIAKSNLNCNGLPEIRMNQEAEKRGYPAPFPDVRPINEYQIYPAYSSVPDNLRQDTGVIIEKFMPEVERDDFAIRHWVFFGAAEHCHRYVSSSNVIKANNIVKKDPVPVPESLRIKRAQMGFDYGKFDFVVHEGEAILFDANKTPGMPPYTGEYRQEIIGKFADGLQSMIAAKLPVFSNNCKSGI